MVSPAPIFVMVAPPPNPRRRIASCFSALIETCFFSISWRISAAAISPYVFCLWFRVMILPVSRRYIMSLATGSDDTFRTAFRLMQWVAMLLPSSSFIWTVKSCAGKICAGMIKAATAIATRAAVKLGFIFIFEIIGKYIDQLYYKISIGVADTYFQVSSYHSRKCEVFI